jgi:type IV pilus assembly protein PilY1
MMHAAWNGRGQFLSAKNPAELINSLQNAISDIASKNAVAAAAVAVDSSSIISGGNVVQAKFDSTYWSGELYSYPITTAGAVSTTPTWAANDLLDVRGYSTRIAVTYNGTTAIPFEFPADYTDSTNFGGTEISQDQLNDLMYNSPNPVTTTDAVQIAENQTFGETLVAYLLGDSTNEGRTVGKLRDRKGHKLGDIIHSAPIYVGDPDSTLYPDSSYQIWANSPTPTGANGRQEMIYVGANDGGLHAFDATTGEEVFVYFPEAVFSNETRSGLHYLADRGYEHRYYVDGELSVAEIYADLDGTGDKWSTILVGTLRGGGRSIFAIDVSDPSEFTTASGVASNILWEFSDVELGYTYGKPTIAKLNNGRWGAIFGNGYLQGATASGEAMLFIKYLDNASPGFEAISTGAGSNLAGDCLDAGSDCNGLSTPAVVDLGADMIADRVYAGDLMGNLWVFDISSASSSSWDLAYATPLINAKTSGGASQQITTRPAVTLHPTRRHSNTSPNTMVFFGTGQYLTETDLISTTSNTFYGVWDNGTPISSARDVALVEQTITNDTLGAEDIRLMTNNTVDYSTHRGWFVDLPDTGERVASRPFTVGDIVVYNSIVPESDMCSSSGGYSWFMVHNLSDGSEPDFIALDVSGDGVFDSTDQKDGKNVSGLKIDSMTSNMTAVTSGTGVDALVPAADITQTHLQTFEEGGGRSSWGRYMMDE